LKYSDLVEAFGYNPRNPSGFVELTGFSGVEYTENGRNYKTTYEDIRDHVGPKFFDNFSDFFGMMTVEQARGFADLANNGKLSDSGKKNLADIYSNILSSDKIQEGDKEILKNLLTSTDWLDPLKSMDIMDTMLSMGIDQDTIQKYWDAATARVDAYVDSEAEALQLAGRMQGKVKNLSELSNRMAEGTMTLDDIMTLEKAGINTSGYKLTAEGWQATSEEIEEATEKMREFYLM
jgi:hypothetical protein